MEQRLTGRQEVQEYKMVLLGSSDVGKSSMAIRLAKDEFRETSPTTGCAFFKHKLFLQGTALEFAIWDTAGQERYQSVCHLYYRGASAALLVYDITRKETFSRAQLWLQELEKYFQHGEVTICLIGNKNDLDTERTVSQEDGQAFAESKGLLFMETSARTGDNVRQAFEAVACELLVKECNREQKDHSNVALQEETRTSHERACCKS